MQNRNRRTGFCFYFFCSLHIMHRIHEGRNKLLDNNLHGKGGVSGIEHRKGAETGHTVSGRLCTGRFIYLYDRLPGNRFLGHPESDADFFSGNRVSGIFFISAEKKRSAGDRYCVDRYDSRRSAASCRYCDVFWNEYWWYAVCHDPAIWLERNFAEPELLSAAGSVLYSGGQYGNQPAGSPGRAEKRQNAGISYGRKKEK